MIKTAVISPCGNYRYLLTRIWSIEPHPRVVCWVMLNPSTADASKDDATLRKCIGFSQRWGFDGLKVVNLFAYRTPYPAELSKAQKAGRDIRGPENDHYLFTTAFDSAHTVVAWGAHRIPGGEGEMVTRELVRRGRTQISCIGKTLSGQPKHPVRPGYATPLEPYFG